MRRGATKLTVSAQVGKTHAAFLSKYLKLALASLAHGDRLVAPARLQALREVSIVLINDRIMEELHQRHMNIAGPTDVLTFPLDVDSRGRVMSGEVLICVPEARRRAILHNSSTRNELLLYALHGLLHLLGHDDRTARAFAAMHKAEDQILMRLGIGPVFSAGEKSR